MKIDFNIGILNTLLYQYPDKAMSLDVKFPKIYQWLEEKDKPTFNQLADLAQLFDIPFGYFFLQEIPLKQYPIPHFRTNNQKQFRPSKELIDTVDTLQERQQWAKDLLIDLRGEKLPFTNSITTKIPIETAVNEINLLLRLSGHWAKSIPRWSDALNLLINRTELSGIFVVLNGVVDNNTKRKLDTNEFRGFVLYDDFAPFVFLNNNDALSGKIFTLIHEIAHVLVGKSASFDLKQLQPASDDTEEYCDRVAAEFLVPRILLEKHVQKYGIDYLSLARVFKVSQIVIARRLLDLSRITRHEFFTFYEDYINREKKVDLSSGGNFYNTAPYRISKRFFSLIHNSVKQNKILYTDAFRLTGLKPKTFDEYIKRNLA
jgi:Zn-dependent peptidase ImmA (M78 family)